MYRVIVRHVGQQTGCSVGLHVVRHHGVEITDKIFIIHLAQQTPAQIGVHHVIRASRELSRQIKSHLFDGQTYASGKGNKV